MSIYVHVYFSLHVCMCINMCAHIPIINVCMYAYLYVCICVSTYTCVFTGWEKGKKRKEEGGRTLREVGGRVMEGRGDTSWKKRGTWWRGGLSEGGEQMRTGVTALRSEAPLLCMHPKTLTTGKNDYVHITTSSSSKRNCATRQEIDCPVT